MKRKIIVTVIVLGLIYISGYILIRQIAQEIRVADGKIYIIFPENKVLYYLYRPLSIVDEKTTRMKFHIGQH